MRDGPGERGAAIELRIDITSKLKPRAILLDIDGTLVDSNGGHAEAWRAACAEFGYDRPLAFFRSMIGMGGDLLLPKIDPALSSERDPGKAMSSRRGEIFKERFLPSLAPTPGARELVERFKRDGMICVVASSSSAAELDALLDVARITSLVDRRTTADDAERSKPAPDIIGVALRKAGVSANEAVMLGDTPYDVEAATKAGVRTIALRCGGWGDDDLAGAVAIYADPAELLARYPF